MSLTEHIKERIRDIFSIIMSGMALLTLFIAPLVEQPMTENTPRNSFYIFVAANILALAGIILGGRGVRTSQKKLFAYIAVSLGFLFWVISIFILWFGPRFINL
ncbi:MAG: hypothetical protein JW976_03445 [Syntrophaceae bacterium]|nr:hypothetical protein [Syntrophaceae bacterium]